MNANSWFCDDYVSARDRFRELAAAANARQEQIEIDARGRRNEPLTIDIAWLGSSAPRNILLHSSGLHGVEGFVGSAIQLSLLDNLPEFSADTAIVMIHVINPYGMSWLRRVNENNVDLNRNFLLDQPHATPLEALPDNERQALQAYCRLNSLLNPHKAVGGLADTIGFYARALSQILRFGLPQLRQAIGHGQHYLPFGLFFGGHQLEQGPERLLNWMRSRLTDVEQVAMVDVHTGLGKFAEDTLLTFYDADSDDYGRLRQALGERVESLASGTTAYTARGFMIQTLEAHLLGPKWTTITQEFGTLSTVKVVKALRDENAWHLYGDRDNVQHPVKQRVLEAFSPNSTRWRENIVLRGRQVVEDMLNDAFADGQS